MPDGRLKLCGDYCREVRKKDRSTSIQTRHRLLRRILEHEIVSMADPLYSSAVYESILIRGCAYCGTDLLLESGISLDRLDSTGKHTFANCRGCCGLCNRLKSAGPKTGGFTNEEMLEVIGPAVALVRRRRKSNVNGGNRNGQTNETKSPRKYTQRGEKIGGEIASAGV
jgi:hypothetical protein